MTQRLDDFQKLLESELTHEKRIMVEAAVLMLEIQISNLSSNLREFFEGK